MRCRPILPNRTSRLLLPFLLVFPAMSQSAMHLGVVDTQLDRQSHYYSVVLKNFG